jgi:phenylacetic acid degradation protein
MVKVYSLDGITPVVHPAAYVHPTAVLIGDVIVGEGAYIGPTACLRGDFGRLVVERGANVQDSCILHGYPGTDTVIEEDGHVGHGAIIHGGRVGRDALIGMNAVINDNAVIGESAVVAAMAFVKAGMVVPSRTLVAGVPARIVRELSAVEIEWKRDGTRIYQELARRSLASMVETTALAAVEPDRRRMDVGPTLPLSEVKKALGPR